MDELVRLWRFLIKIQDPLESLLKGTIDVLVAVRHIFEPSLNPSKDAIVRNLV